MYFLYKHRYIFIGLVTIVVQTDYKPLIRFLTANTYKDIFFRQVEKLRPLNIRLAQIEGKRNQATDSLSRTIFEEDYCLIEKTRKLLREVERHNTDRKREQFQKSGKGGYQEMLRDLISMSEKAKLKAKSVAVITSQALFLALQREVTNKLDIQDLSYRAIRRKLGPKIGSKRDRTQTPIRKRKEKLKVSYLNYRDTVATYYRRKTQKLYSRYANIRKKEEDRGVDTKVDQSQRSQVKPRRISKKIEDLVRPIYEPLLSRYPNYQNKVGSLRGPARLQVCSYYNRARLE